MPERTRVEALATDLAALSEWQRQVYLEPLELGRIVATRFLPPDQQNIELGYVDASSLNASAGRRSERYRVRIHLAVAAISHFVFNSLFRHPGLLPNIGSFLPTDRFGVFDNGIPTSLPQGVPAERAAAHLVAISKPSSDERAALAAIATRIALSFCILHEVAHILNGHARYAALNFEEAEIMEFLPGHLQSASELALRRVWEYEADKTAAAFLVQWLATDSNLRTHVRELLGRGVERNLLWLAGFSLRVLFQLLAQVKRETPQAVHASPRVRSEIVQVAMNYTNRKVRAAQREKLLIASHGHADALWMILVSGSEASADGSPTDTVLSSMDELEDLLVAKRSEYEALAYLTASPQGKPD